MISQIKLNLLIKENDKEIDRIDKILTEHPEKMNNPYSPNIDPSFTFSSYLTKLVSRKLTLMEVNQQI